MKPLSQKQELFAIAVANGETPTEAYHRAWPKASRKTCTEQGSRITRVCNVAARIEEIHQEKRTAEAALYAQATASVVEEFRGKLLTSYRRRQLLQARAENPLLTEQALVAILTLDARLAGDLIEKQELTGKDGVPLPSVVPSIVVNMPAALVGRRPLAPLNGNS